MDRWDRTQLLIVHYRDVIHAWERRRRGQKVVVRAYYRGSDERGHVFLTGDGLVAVPDERLLSVEES